MFLLVNFFLVLISILGFSGFSYFFFYFCIIGVCFFFRDDGARVGPAIPRYGRQGHWPLPLWMF